MLVPEELRYAETHEWVRIDKTIGTVGIVESVKAASDIYSPVSGEVTEVNSELESNPALVNTAPYAEGWLFKVQLEEGADLSGLKDAAAYRTQIGPE
jgi:glycine cleavage system H protein